MHSILVFYSVNEFACDFSYKILLSHNCLCGWARVVSAPIQRYTALSVQLCGVYVMHREALYLQAAIGTSKAKVVDSCFCDFNLFFCTEERLFKGRHCRGPAKGSEGNWLFLHCFKTFQSYSFSSSGIFCHFKAHMSRIFDKFAIAHSALICLQHQLNT